LHVLFTEWRAGSYEGQKYLTGLCLKPVGIFEVTPEIKQSSYVLKQAFFSLPCARKTMVHNLQPRPSIKIYVAVHM